MLHVPSMPAWEAIHPLIIHFPIVLLLVAPVFIAAGALLPPNRGRPYLNAACALVLLGAASLYLAVSTGEAAAELAQRDETIDRVLGMHQHAAFQLRIAFSILAAALLGIVMIPVFRQSARTRLWSTVLPIIFLVPYAVAVVGLVNTAHQGGRLVHQFGIHAMMPPDSGSASSAEH